MQGGDDSGTARQRNCNDPAAPQASLSVSSRKRRKSNMRTALTMVRSQQMRPKRTVIQSHPQSHHLNHGRQTSTHTSSR